MSTRPVPEVDLDPEVFGVPIDLEALSPEERAFIQVGIDELDRGEFVTHEDVFAWLLARREARRRT